MLSGLIKSLFIRATEQLPLCPQQGSKIKTNFFQIPFHIKINAPPFWYSLGARLIRGLGDYHSLGYWKFHLQGVYVNYLTEKQISKLYYKMPSTMYNDAIFVACMYLNIIVMLQVVSLIISCFFSFFI